MPRRIFLFITTFLALGLGACGGKEETETAPVVRPAKLLTVGNASQRREMSFPAVVRATQSAELTFPVAGEVTELNVLEGAEVTKGDQIARLDDRNARNSLAQAQAELENTKTEFERAKRLRDQDAISQSVLDTRETQLEVQQAAVRNARKALEDTTIRAPFTGNVSRVYVEQFQNVQAKEPIATVQSNATEAIVNIPGTIVARVPQLQPIGTTVVLDAAPDIEIPGTFREASGQADPTTQTYQISFTFDPPENLLILPGMTATVRSTFLFRDVPDIAVAGIAVPIDAIIAEGEQRYVWVVGDDMTLAKRVIQVAPDISDSITVISGLESGETIVAAGGAFMAEGMTVRAWAPE
ncbi:MAG: efflux RND transporter periplasmic adaptor subunit [Pseudomonadota bacterium]